MQCDALLLPPPCWACVSGSTANAFCLSVLGQKADVVKAWFYITVELCGLRYYVEKLEEKVGIKTLVEQKESSRDKDPDPSVPRQRRAKLS